MTVRSSPCGDREGCAGHSDGLLDAVSREEQPAG